VTKSKHDDFVINLILDKRKTMVQPSLQHLTVLEEASVSMEQSNELKSDDDAPQKMIEDINRNTQLHTDSELK